MEPDTLVYRKELRPAVMYCVHCQKFTDHRRYDVLIENRPHIVSHCTACITRDREAE